MSARPSRRTNTKMEHGDSPMPSLPGPMRWELSLRHDTSVPEAGAGGVRPEPRDQGTLPVLAPHDGDCG